MRTKNGKRIGPVPITLAVFALAAFLSVGLWLVPSGQTIEAQGTGDAPTAKCQVDKNNNAIAADSASNQLAVSIADNCFVTGNTATVEFNNDTTSEMTRHIYTDGRITGGTNLKVRFQDDQETGKPATANISYYKLKVPAKAQGSDDAGTATITVSRNGKPQIRLDAYAGASTPEIDDETGENNGITSPAPSGASDTIVFTPSLDTPDAGASSVVVNGSVETGSVEIDEDEDEANILTVFKDSATAEFDMVWGSDGENAIAVGGGGVQYDIADVGDLASFLVPGAVITISNEDGSYEREVTLNATSRNQGDEDGTGGVTPIDGEDIEVTASLSRNVEGTVTVTVGGGDDVMLEAGLSQGKSLTMTAKQARSTGTDLKVVGLPETGNIRVEVSAEFDGDTGTLTEKGYAMRSNGVVDSVSAKTYSCKQDDVDAEMMDDPSSDDEEDMIADPSEICAVEARESTKVSDLTESATFSPGSMFLIVATVADSVGNPLENERVTARQSAGPSRAAISAGAEDTDKKGMARLQATAKGEDDADGGTYTLNIARGSVRTTVDVNLAGDVAMLSFPDGKQTDPIPGNTGVGSFTVKASDVNGNLPINVGDEDDDFEVLISVRPSKSTVLGENKIKFDAKTGEATFFVQVSDEAELGDSLTITVTAIGDSSVMPAVLAVTYDDAPPEVMEPGTELGKASNVTTGPFNEGGVVQVNWDSAPNATGYIIYAVNVDELDDPDGQIVVKAVNDAAAMTYNLEGLNVGANYDIYVVATAPAMAEWPEDADVQHVTAN